MIIEPVDLKKEEVRAIDKALNAIYEDYLAIEGPLNM